MHYGKTSKTHADARTATFAATAGHAGISHAADAGTSMPMPCMPPMHEIPCDPRWLRHMYHHLKICHKYELEMLKWYMRYCESKHDCRHPHRHHPHCRRPYHCHPHESPRHRWKALTIIAEKRPSFPISPRKDGLDCTCIGLIFHSFAYIQGTKNKRNKQQKKDNHS